VVTSHGDTSGDEGCGNDDEGYGDDDEDEDGVGRYYGGHDDNDDDDGVSDSRHNQHHHDNVRRDDHGRHCGDDGAEGKASEAVEGVRVSSGGYRGSGGAFHGTSLSAPSKPAAAAAPAAAFAAAPGASGWANLAFVRDGNARAARVKAAASDAASAAALAAEAAAIEDVVQMPSRWPGDLESAHGLFTHRAGRMRVFMGPGSTGKLCSFYQEGNCRFGNRCVHLHELGTSCALCGENVPASERLSHTESCSEHLAARKEEVASRAAECSMCLEHIRAKGQKFGLLSHCAHAFCLPCAREWRERAFGADSLSKEIARACPACRIVSYYVIPSDRLVTDPERKERLAAVYRARLATLPCRYFNPRTKADCPFGSSCFYAHQDAQGNDIKETQPRLKQDSDGNMSVLTAPTMSEFIDFSALKAVKSKKGARH
jgi:E3 ubiquitin-protein ligase makorin